MCPRPLLPLPQVLHAFNAGVKHDYCIAKVAWDGQRVRLVDNFTRHCQQPGPILLKRWGGAGTECCWAL